MGDVMQIILVVGLVIYCAVTTTVLGLIILRSVKTENAIDYLLDSHSVLHNNIQIIHGNIGVIHAELTNSKKLSDTQEEPDLSKIRH